jgi:hypothetical protein
MINTVAKKKLQLISLVKCIDWRLLGFKRTEKEKAAINKTANRIFREYAAKVKMKK